jgi:DNA-binding transcriptional MocR family regulator
MKAVLSQPANHLYEKVADEVAQLIDQRILRAGDRAPSVRKLMAQKGVSRSTALQAFQLLEGRGLVEARPQSGYYVKPQREHLLPEPELWRDADTYDQIELEGTAAKVAEVIASFRHHPEYAPFGVATPSPEILPNRALNRVLAAAARQAGGSGNNYDFPPGHEELRRQIALRAPDAGHQLAMDEIVTTFGCMESLNLALRATCRPGDCVAIESPTYYGVLQALESLGLSAIEIPTHPQHGVDLPALEATLDKKKVAACLFSTSFNNPLGSNMPEENRRALVQDILAPREIPLIEDEIYADLFHGTMRPKSCRAFDREGLVLVCSSFSKCLAPGYRVGWIVPGRFGQRVQLLKFMNTLATATHPQAAIADFMKSGAFDHHMRSLRKRMREQVTRVSAAVAEYFPAGTRVTRPAGGFVLWLELPGHVNALRLHQQALAVGISIAPGPIFSAKQRFENFIRLSCGHPWTPRLEHALMTLGRLAGK